MLFKMIAFEWRYFVRQPSFIVTCLLFPMLPVLNMLVPGMQLGAGGNVVKNSPYSINLMLLILSIFAMAMVINFVGNTATRNHSQKMAEIITTKPINAFHYNFGRFIGAYLVCVTVFSMILVGAWLSSTIAPSMPWVDAERFNPNQLRFYLTPFLIFSVTTLFVQAAIFYAIALRTSNLMYVYVIALGLFVIYNVSGVVFDEPHQRTVRALLDPFGIRTYGDFTRYWTAFERNNNVAELTGVILQNRLIWVSIGLVTLLVGGRFFKPLSLREHKTKTSKRSKRDATNVQPDTANLSFAGVHDASATSSPTLPSFLTRTRLELAQVFKSPAFIILICFSIIQQIAISLLSNGWYGTPDLPMTHFMIDIINGAFGIMLMVVTVYYTGEIVWRDRSVQIADIIDSSPVHNVIFWSSKFVAVCALYVALYLVAAIIAIGIQLFAGFDDIDLAQYAISLTYFSILPWIVTAALAFFLQVISPNKYIGMLLFILVMAINLTATGLGIEHPMFQFANAPLLRYSDMNGYGGFLTSQFWFSLYWGGLAVVLAVLSYGLWRRGPDAKVRQRLGQLSYQIGNKGWLILLVGLGLFVGAGANIHYNTRVVNEFIGSEASMDRVADYEKRYIKHKDANNPMVRKVDAEIAIYPQERRVSATAAIDVVNQGRTPISRFMLTLPPNLSNVLVEIDGGEQTEHDETLRVLWFEFDRPMQPGDRRKGSLTSEIDFDGFRALGEDPSIVANGTFINNMSLFPTFGFSKSSLLENKHERKKRGLEPAERAYLLEDTKRHYEHGFDRSMDFIDFSATISTAADQFAIAPGYLTKEWEEGGRRFYRYEMDAPMLNFFNVLSARVDVRRELYNGVNIEVYYHPTHHWNIDRMIQATKDSLDYFQAEFGPYQHRQMRIIEFPGYRTFAQSFANTVSYSENIGFIKDLSSAEDLDVPYFITAHEMAHQWWGHQLGVANVQGGQVLSETLSQYSALMVMEKKYGVTKLRKFLTYELDTYLASRNAEAIEEMPLLRSENQNYIHYQKGGVVMMAIKNKLGEARLNRALKGLLDEFRFKSDPYPTTLDLVRYIKAEANDEERAYIDDQFNKISLYDLRAEEVASEALENGQYKVTFKVVAKQFSADGKGKETEVDFSERVEIGLFTDNPNDFSADAEVIYAQEHSLISGDNTVEIIVDREPAYIGVDPFVRFIDRDTGNNILKL